MAMGFRYPQEWVPTLQACRTHTPHSLQQPECILQDPPPASLQASACWPLWAYLQVGTQVRVGSQVWVGTHQIYGMGTHSQAHSPTLHCNPLRSRSWPTPVPCKPHRWLAQTL